MSKQEITLTPVSGDACCTPISDASLAPAAAAEGAAVFKALADPVRLRLLSIITSAGGEMCVCELTPAFDLSQPTISHHMKVLHEAGLVDRDKRGVWVYYRIRPQALASLGALIASPPATVRINAGDT